MEESKVEIMKKQEQKAAFDDSKLRKVSITTNSLLFNDNSYSNGKNNQKLETNQKVYQLLAQMKQKYRMFLVTQVSGDGEVDHIEAKAAI